MANENNSVNRDTANSLGSYLNYANKGINAGLNTASQINKWYEKELDKITKEDNPSTRLKTNVDNSLEETEDVTQNKLETKVDSYDELQTSTNNKSAINKSNKIKTKTDATDENITTNKSKKVPKRIATAIKGAKIINNSANRMVKTGKTISAGMNENGINTFQKSSSRLMTKPIKKVANKATNKLTKKATNILVKAGSKFAKKTGKQVVKGTMKLMVKLVQLLIKLMASVVKGIIAMLPQLAPIIIIIVVIAAFCSFFGLGMSEDSRSKYENYMIETQEDYNKSTVEFYNQGKIVEGAIEGKGMINWRAPLSIIQMLNGDLEFDSTEKDLLEEFKKADLFEKVTEESYSYEKEVEETDDDGNVTTKMETVTETKKVVSNPSLDDYIDWCNNHFDKINNYKKKKKVEYDSEQTAFTEDEISQIRLLYKSSSFFDLFSNRFKDTYAYTYVTIDDEKLQAIYDEFLRNAGKRYLLDHSNLKYDECMDYYDCSSWVIHVLAHTGIKTIPNTRCKWIIYCSLCTCKCK